MQLDELHAAILVDALLPRLDDWTARRRGIAGRYLAEIRNPAIALVPGPDPDGSVWHLFPVLVAPDQRADFMAYLADAGVQAGQHYPILIPDQKAMTDHGTPMVAGPLTRARTFAEGEVSLPIQPFLTEDEVSYVIAIANAWAS